MMNEIYKIPPIRLGIDHMAATAEAGGCYCFEGKIRSMVFCIDERNTAILTYSKGYLLVKHEDLPVLIDELQGIHNDLDRIKRVVL